MRIAVPTGSPPRTVHERVKRSSHPATAGATSPEGDGNTVTPDSAYADDQTEASGYTSWASICSASSVRRHSVPDLPDRMVADAATYPTPFKLESNATSIFLKPRPQNTTRKHAFNGPAIRITHTRDGPIYETIPFMDSKAEANMTTDENQSGYYQTLSDDEPQEVEIPKKGLTDKLASYINILTPKKTNKKSNITPSPTIPKETIDSSPENSIAHIDIQSDTQNPIPNFYDAHEGSEEDRKMPALENPRATRTREAIKNHLDEDIIIRNLAKNREEYDMLVVNENVLHDDEDINDLDEIIRLRTAERERSIQDTLDRTSRTLREYDLPVQPRNALRQTIEHSDHSYAQHRKKSPNNCDENTKKKLTPNPFFPSNTSGVANFTESEEDEFAMKPRKFKETKLNSDDSSLSSTEDEEQKRLNKLRRHLKKCTNHDEIDDYVKKLVSSVKKNNQRNEDKELAAMIRHFSSQALQIAALKWHDDPQTRQLRFEKYIKQFGLILAQHSKTSPLLANWPNSIPTIPKHADKAVFTLLMKTVQGKQVEEVLKGVRTQLGSDALEELKLHFAPPLTTQKLHSNRDVINFQQRHGQSMIQALSYFRQLTNIAKMNGNEYSQGFLVDIFLTNSNASGNIRYAIEINRLQQIRETEIENDSTGTTLDTIYRSFAKIDCDTQSPRAQSQANNVNTQSPRRNKGPTPKTRRQNSPTSTASQASTKQPSRPSTQNRRSSSNQKPLDTGKSLNFFCDYHGWNSSHSTGPDCQKHQVYLQIKEKFKNEKCHLCGKVGHIKSICPTRKEIKKDDNYRLRHARATFVRHCNLGSDTESNSGTSRTSHTPRSKTASANFISHEPNKPRNIDSEVVQSFELESDLELEAFAGSAESVFSTSQHPPQRSPTMASRQVNAGHHANRSPAGSPTSRASSTRSTTPLNYHPMWYSSNDEDDAAPISARPRRPPTQFEDEEIAATSAGPSIPSTSTDDTGTRPVTNFDNLRNSILRPPTVRPQMTTHTAHSTSTTTSNRSRSSQWSETTQRTQQRIRHRRARRARRRAQAAPMATPTTAATQNINAMPTDLPYRPARPPTPPSRSRLDRRIREVTERQTTYAIAESRFMTYLRTHPDAVHYRGGWRIEPNIRTTDHLVPPSPPSTPDPLKRDQDDPHWSDASEEAADARYQEYHSLVDNYQTTEAPRVYITRAEAFGWNGRPGYITLGDNPNFEIYMPLGMHGSLPSIRARDPAHILPNDTPPWTPHHFSRIRNRFRSRPPAIYKPQRREHHHASLCR